MAVGFRTNGTANGKVPERGERGTGLDSLAYSYGDELAESYGAGEPLTFDLTRMLGRDPMAQALETALTLPVLHNRFEIEPAEGDTGEAETCRRMLLEPPGRGGMQTPINSVAAQMSGAFALRRAYFEKVWGGERGQMRLLKLAHRPPETCTVRVDGVGGYDGFRQRGFRPRGGYVNEPFGPEKAFVYVHGGTRFPLTGQSALRTAYQAHTDKLEMLKLWREHLQQYSLGVLVGTHSAKADKDQREGFFKKLKKIRGGGRFAKHPDESLEILKSAGTSDEYITVARYYDQQMAISALVQFLMLGTGSETGSWALSSDQSDFFVMSCESRLGEMAAQLTADVMADITRLNHGSGGVTPIGTFPPLSGREKDRALEVWQALVTAATHTVDPEVVAAIQEKALRALGVEVEKAGV